MGSAPGGGCVPTRQTVFETTRVVRLKKMKAQRLYFVKSAVLITSSLYV